MHANCTTRICLLQLVTHASPESPIRRFTSEHVNSMHASYKAFKKTSAGKDIELGPSAYYRIVNDMLGKQGLRLFKLGSGMSTFCDGFVATHTLKNLTFSPTACCSAVNTNTVDHNHCPYCKVCAERSRQLGRTIVGLKQQQEDYRTEAEKCHDPDDPERASALELADGLQHTIEVLQARKQEEDSWLDAHIEDDIRFFFCNISKFVLRMAWFNVACVRADPWLLIQNIFSLRCSGNNCVVTPPPTP